MIVLSLFACRYTQSWFLSLFSFPSMPTAHTARIWDSFLVQGFETLFRCALLFISACRIYHVFAWCLSCSVALALVQHVGERAPHCSSPLAMLVACRLTPARVQSMCREAGSAATRRAAAAAAAGRSEHRGRRPAARRVAVQDRPAARGAHARNLTLFWSLGGGFVCMQHECARQRVACCQFSDVATLAWMQPCNSDACVAGMELIDGHTSNTIASTGTVLGSHKGRAHVDHKKA